MRVLKAIYNVVRYVLMAAIICLLAIILTQRLSNNEKAVAGLRIFNVVTESMVPEYLVGDTILVKTVNPEELKVGDDVTYLGEKESFAGLIVTHRIIEKEKNEDGSYRIVTKGIANPREDPEITDKQIYGKVLYKIKSISYINSVIGNLYGMYFAIIVPMALMMFFEFIGYRRDKEKELMLEEDEREYERNRNRDRERDRDIDIDSERYEQEYRERKNRYDEEQEELEEKRKKRRKKRDKRRRKRHMK